MIWTRLDAGRYTNSAGIVIWKDNWSGAWCISVNGVYRESAKTLKEAKTKAELI